MKKLALFDFDGTLTTQDSFLAFLKFYKGKSSFFIGLLWLSPMLVLYKLGIIPNWRAKELVMTHFLKGEPVERFNAMSNEFALNIIPQMIRREALTKLDHHIANGDEVVVVTASATNWVKPWADKQGVSLVATQLQVDKELITGKIEGKNCYGPEKVTRLCEIIKLEDYEEISAYGDSRGDKELLAIASKRFYRRFD